MVYKFFGSLFFVLIGISLMGVFPVPTILTGIFALGAGVALFFGH